MQRKFKFIIKKLFIRVLGKEKWRGPLCFWVFATLGEKVSPSLFVPVLIYYLFYQENGVYETLSLYRQDIEDLDHYEMKEEEPVDGKKSEDDGIEKENLAILEKIRKNQRQDHLNVSRLSCSAHRAEEYLPYNFVFVLLVVDKWFDFSDVQKQ